MYDLDAQNRPVPVAVGALPADARAVVGFPAPARFDGADPGFARLADRAFLYDNALALLWLTHTGHAAEARQLVATLVALQRADGAWGFGFSTAADDSFYNAAYVRTGTVAWVVYALAHYRQTSGDHAADVALDRGVRYLLAQRDPQTGLLRGGRGRWRTASAFEPDWPADFAATEHQIDSWFALRAVDLAWPTLGTQLHLRDEAARLAQATDRWLWLPNEKRFAQGRQGPKLDLESALDASGTWAALWLIARGERSRANDVLAWVARVHAVEVDGWPGWRPYRDEPPVTWFVEGSLAIPLARHRLGQHADVATLWQTVLELVCVGGVPVVYASHWATDFPLTPAAAPSLWFLVVGQELGASGSGWLWTESPG